MIPQPLAHRKLSGKEWVGEERGPVAPSGNFRRQLDVCVFNKVSVGQVQQFVGIRGGVPSQVFLFFLYLNPAFTPAFYLLRKFPGIDLIDRSPPLAFCHGASGGKGKDY